jgi:CDP-glucose 4,6-dehydratase
MEGVVTQGGFWNGRRVLVTGHTGFKGSWLSLLLNRLGAAVTGYALPPLSSSIFNLARVPTVLADDFRYDICNHEALANAINAADPEIILHLAAQPLVKAGYADPVETYRVNVLGVAHILEAARRHSNVRVVLIVTSDKCYEVDPDGLPHSETARLGGRDPYSASKACAELVVSSYETGFPSIQSPRIVTARSGNVIGGGDFAPDRIVPDTIRAFMSGRPLSLRMPRAVRPWQHVLDPLFGYLLLAEQTSRTSQAGAWNFGPDEDDEHDVEALVTKIAAAWGEPASWFVAPTQHPPETVTLRLDSRKARLALGWRPLLDFSTTVDWTCDWYRAYAGGADMHAITLSQIDSYLALRTRQDAAHNQLSSGNN